MPARRVPADAFAVCRPQARAGTRVPVVEYQGYIAQLTGTSYNINDLPELTNREDTHTHTHIYIYIYNYVDRAPMVRRTLRWE